jgi:hypothetical protein
MKRELFNLPKHIVSLFKVRDPEPPQSYLVFDWIPFTNGAPYWRATAQVPTYKDAMGWVDASSQPSAVIKTDKAKANDLYRKTVFSTEEIEDLGATIFERV